jgi:putative transposase
VSRLRRIADRERIFFVTANIARGQTPFTPNERYIVLETLAAQRTSGALLLYGYVVMPDHLHLLLRPNSSGLMETLRDFKRISALRIALAGKRTGPLWQARYFDHILRRARNFSEKLDYIHRNPVEAGLVAAPADWHWSSVLAYVDMRDTLPHASPRQSAPIPVDPIALPFDASASLWPL